ncbi:MAG TPA: TM0106 family RecB-like putative nuclease [Thermoanaerobaculia bacterium]|nr:TM0106 family RecB-like putative nuclease [Thermoanaerobaculia bacterium]
MVRDGAALRAAADEVVASLRRGDDVVYQATLFDERWRGHADFLIRTSAPSDLGAWSYEVFDTKLARRVTAGALLQLCLYSDLLATIQGRRPERMHVVLGGSARRVESHRVADYEAYYRLVKRRYEEFTASGELAFPPATRPEPVEHCEVCRWSVDCRKERRRVDDASLIAGITGRQRRDLREHGFATRRSVAALPSPVPWTIDRRQVPALVRVREQARIQIEGEAAGHAIYELLAPRRTREGELQENLGLLSIPPPSSGDLFFDMEGDPYSLDDGFDYLFGIVEPGLLAADGMPTYHRFWSTDDMGTFTRTGEKRAFEQVVDFFMSRWSRDPQLHIYHFAPYEPSAMGRLMGRHATREEEVDRLLRGGVFVDLFRAVRQSLRASVEGYSIKQLEPLYGFERLVELRDAGSSIVAFTALLDSGGAVGGDSRIFDSIEAYNRDDCTSNRMLRDWLEDRRHELEGIIGGPAPRPKIEDPRPSDTLSEHLARVAAAEQRLISEPVGEGGQTDKWRARWLLAQLLSWHRREDKAAWWRWFLLLDDLTDDERIEEPEPIGGLEYIGVEAETPRSLVHRYRFPPQDHEVRPGRPVKDPATKKSPGTVVDVDNAAGTLDLKRSRTNTAPHPTSVVPEMVIQTSEQRDSLLRIGEWVVEHGIEGPGLYRAARELLLRRPPRVGQAEGESLAGAEPAELAARRLVSCLDGSCLAIQGPPGSGKTTKGAEMIVDLVRAGKRVAVTANSHRVIGNMLDGVAAAASKRRVQVRIGQKPEGREPCTSRTAELYADNDAVLAGLRSRQVDVVGGTVWLWAREELAGQVDALFVDEAGQMSLANVVAASPCASNLVLLGDPQQLDQPVRGSHPPGAERSALAHLLNGDATIRQDLGLFLERTWRLHPDICAFTSEVFYDGRLAPEPGRERQVVVGSGPLHGSGIRYLPVVHSGNARDSSEEAEEVKRRVLALLGAEGRWTDDELRVHPIGLDDVLVITPYNAQVQTMAEALPGVRVGTVDKFQGQQAPIAIYTMATSSAEEAPRGMEFLYNLHRLNVATSRARCLAVVVASPALHLVRCRTPRQMQLANALCRLVELAT